MKPNNFTLSWNGRPAQPDKLMTRTLAARLLWCWRRASRDRANDMAIESLQRIARGSYRATSRRGAETASLTLTITH